MARYIIDYDIATTGESGFDFVVASSADDAVTQFCVGNGFDLSEVVICGVFKEVKSSKTRRA